MAAAACLASLALYAPALWQPVLIQDDFQILEQSWTWERTCEGIWKPHNEHVMPLGRLLTWGLVCLAGRQTAVPGVCVLLGPLALVAGMLLTNTFVRRETGHPLPGLVAMTLFGVSCVYQQAVYWFSASFSILALDTLLLALLAAQRWREASRPRDLALVAVGTALAPAWFASGVLAGPLVALYLLPWGEEWRRPRRWLGVPAALLGTGLFLALSLPRAADTIMHLEHYEGQTAVEKFDIRAGMISTGRSVVDNLLLGVFGIGGFGFSLPLPAAALVLAGLAAAGVWWWRRAPHRRLLLLGLGLVVSSYLLVYSARAAWGYEGVMTLLAWSRYHLQPQLGLALFLAGGLIPVAGAPGLCRRQARAVAWLIALCFLVQLPRAVGGRFEPNDKQAARLRQIEDMDARCREHHIAAEDARRTLPRQEMKESASRVNCWELLWGSAEPRPRPPEEVRRLLGR